jgi:hypothetical protein
MSEPDKLPVAFVPDETNCETDDLYEIIGYRQQALDTTVWQFPILSLTGQAFLMMISLGPDYSIAARAVSSFLSIAVSLTSIHAMWKARVFEIEDSRWCAEYERRRWGKQRGKKAAPHDGRRLISSNPFYVRMRSVRAWTVTLGLFGLVSLIILVAAVFPCCHPLFSYLSTK